MNEEQRRELDAIVSAFRAVIATDAGKRVLFWMLEQCAIYQDAFTGEDAATNYTLGLQAGGRKLIAMLDAIDPRFYPRLLLDIADIKIMDRAAANASADNGEDEE